KFIAAIPICFRLFVHWARRAASRADWTAGRSSAIRTAMIAITTRSSIRVKARRFFMSTTSFREEDRKPWHEKRCDKAGERWRRDDERDDIERGPPDSQPASASSGDSIERRRVLRAGAIAVNHL